MIEELNLSIRPRIESEVLKQTADIRTSPFEGNDKEPSS